MTNFISDAPFPESDPELFRNQYRPMPGKEKQQAEARSRSADFRMAFGGADHPSEQPKLMPSWRQIALKIERQSNENITMVSVIARIRSEHLSELETHLNDYSECVMLDLGEVTLVDADVVRFLSAREEAGVTLVRCPAYVREWILRERAER